MKGITSPRWLWFAAGALLILLVSLLRSQLKRELPTRDEKPVSTQESPTGNESRSAQMRESFAPPAVAKVQPARETEIGGRDPVTTSLKLEVRLIGGGESARSGKLTSYIAAAEINPEDLAEQNARAARGGTGAGAANVSELANVINWTSAALQAQDDNPADIIAVSQILPVAPLYEVAAYDFASERLYHQRISREQAIGAQPVDISPNWATGLLVRLQNAEKLGSHIAARIDRQPSHNTADAETAGQLLRLIQLFKPALADCLLEQDPLLLSTTATTTIAPLPPDPTLGITLSTATGVETGPLVFQLERGSIRPIDIDCATLFAAQDIGGVRLQARILLEPNNLPLSSAVVSRLNNDIATEQLITDGNGTVGFPGIPLSQPTQFAVETTATSKSGRLLAPRTLFTFEPQATTSTECQVTWKLRPYAWLVLQKPSTKPAQVYRPYPIYLLQSRGTATDPWKAVPLDEYAETETEVAVAVESDGEYRLGMALSPIEIHYTTSATSRSDKESSVQLDVAPAKTFTLRLKAPEGQSYNGQLFISAVRSLPPLRLDVNGSVKLSATESEIEVAAPGFQPVRVATDLAGDNRELVVTLQKL